MVLLRRVKSYSCRSAPSEESPQHAPFHGRKKETGTGTTRQRVPDPPTTCNIHPWMPLQYHSDIPYMVTIEATTSDDISELKDSSMEGRNTEDPRPLTPIPNSKHGVLQKDKISCVSQFEPIVCVDEDWPSDEEGEINRNTSLKSVDFAATALNLCGLGDCLTGPTPIQQARIDIDDRTENVSSTRNMAVTCSGSSYANSFSPLHCKQDFEGDHRDNRDPAIADEHRQFE